MIQMKGAMMDKKMKEVKKKVKQKLTKCCHQWTHKYDVTEMEGGKITNNCIRKYIL